MLHFIHFPIHETVASMRLNSRPGFSLKLASSRERLILLLGRSPLLFLHDEARLVILPLTLSCHQSPVSGSRALVSVLGTSSRLTISNRADPFPDPQFLRHIERKLQNHDKASPPHPPPTSLPWVRVPAPSCPPSSTLSP